MGYDQSVWVFRFDPVDGIAGEFDVHVTRTLPKIHFTSGLFHDPGTEVGVRDKQDRAVFWCLLDDADGIARGADDITECLHTGRAVDVGDDVIILLFVLFEEFFKILSRA